MASIANTGTTDARNVRILIPLPLELRGQAFRAGWDQASDGSIEEPRPHDWSTNDINHQAVLEIPVLSAGKTALFFVEYPSIGQQGHSITCLVYVDGQRVTEEQQWIMPGL